MDIWWTKKFILLSSFVSKINLGESKVIISIVENGDSKDNTRKYLENFQDYLNKKNIINRFSLIKEIHDPRLKIKPFLKTPPSRIEYYSKLRNKCLELLYELNNLDFENTIVIFFNDILFRYEDIINLLSTNNENFDAVCGFDMINNFITFVIIIFIIYISFFYRFII